MILEMMTVFGWLADRSGLRALIVTGDGPAFCSGGDVNTFKDGVTADEVDLPSEVRRGAEALHNAIVDLRRIPFPVIAAVNGPAAGAGFSLALACDIRIASESCFLACAYGRIGASPGRRHDLLPAADRRPEPGAGTAPRRPQHQAPAGARGEAGQRSRLRRMS